MEGTVGLFAVLLLLYFLVHAEHGSIPAATDTISKEFGLEKIDLGVLGSLIFVGLTFGGGVAGYLYKTQNPKVLQISCVVGMAVCTTVFPAAGYIKAVAYTSRLFVGFAQVFVLIYVPVWVDAFASPHLRTIWLALVQVVGVLGVVGGYAITATAELIDNVNITQWRLSFYFQASLMLPCVLLIAFYPTRMLSPGNVTDFEVRRDSNYFTDVGRLLNNRLYMCCVMLLTTSYFILTGFQFWGPDYAANVTDYTGDVHGHG